MPGEGLRLPAISCPGWGSIPDQCPNRSPINPPPPAIPDRSPIPIDRAATCSGAGLHRESIPRLSIIDYRSPRHRSPLPWPPPVAPGQACRIDALGARLLSPAPLDALGPRALPCWIPSPQPRSMRSALGCTLPRPRTMLSAARGARRSAAPPVSWQWGRKWLGAGGAAGGGPLPPQVKPPPMEPPRPRR